MTATFPSEQELATIREKQAGMSLDDLFASLDDSAAPAVPTTAATRFTADGSFTDAAKASSFMMAGNATVTMVSKKTRTRFTFKISQPKDDGRGDTGFRFVSVLNGPDNWSNYQYFGYIRGGIFLHGGAKAKVRADAPSAKAFAWAWQQIARGSIPESLEVWHEGKCGRCGRKLTVPSSIASGLGPECAGRMEG